MAQELTELLIRSKQPTEKRQEIADGYAKARGLYLIIQPAKHDADGKLLPAKMSWAVRYRWNGKSQKFTIGPYPRFSLRQAREQVPDVLRKLGGANGVNPMAEKRAVREKDRAAAKLERHTFRAVVEGYLQAKASLRSLQEMARLLGLRRDHSDANKWQAEQIAGSPVAVWGKRSIQAVDYDDIADYLAGTRQRGPIIANAIHGVLRSFFNWVVEQKKTYRVDASPMAGMKPPTERAVAKAQARARNRALLKFKTKPGSTDDELRWLWKASEAYDRSEPGEDRHGRKLRGPFGPLVQMLLLTGQRRDEVADMIWAEVNLEAGEWIIPGSRTKNKTDHLVPLSDEALAVLATVPRIEGEAGWVFTTNGRKPVNGWSRMKRRLDKLMGEMAKAERGANVTIRPWRLHDLRRTCATGMQRLGIRLEITGMVINHTLSGGANSELEEIYQIDDYADEKRKALAAWGRFVMSVVEQQPASNVVPLHA